MKRPFIIIFVLASFITLGQTTKTQREGQPDIYNINDEDKEMNEAIKKSRQTFDSFLTAFKSQKRNQTNFSVKMPFPTKDGLEHIWLVNIESKDGKLLGQVDNLPDKVTNIKLGDKIEIDQNKISDWFYLEGDKLIGGLTIRVLRDRMPPAEKKQFDQEFGVRFD
ncbi:MAG TPA: DUF2314 domain-containing protein [Cyclobacteriaceae bacterium]